MEKKIAFLESSMNAEFANYCNVQPESCWENFAPDGPAIWSNGPVDKVFV